MQSLLNRGSLLNCCVLNGRFQPYSVWGSLLSPVVVLEVGAEDAPVDVVVAEVVHPADFVQPVHGGPGEVHRARAAVATVVEVQLEEPQEKTAKERKREK